MPLERRRIERVEMQGVAWIKADGGEVHLALADAPVRVSCFARLGDSSYMHN